MSAPNGEPIVDRVKVEIEVVRGDIGKTSGDL